MLKYPFIFILICLFPFYVQANNSGFVLEQTPAIAPFTDIDFDSLCEVAEQTLHYFKQHPEDSFAVHGGEALLEFSHQQRVTDTLAFICQIHAEDRPMQQPKRLHSKAFFVENFDFYRWYPDKKGANNIAQESKNSNKKNILNHIPTDQILLTKYYTKLLKASSVKTDVYNQALYALPYDEHSLSSTEAYRQKDKLTRFKYSRQQIIKGALAKENLAKPLVWVTEKALHDVLLQGTGVLNVDGKTRYFNVHRNNDIAYDYSIGKTEQARYWYFAEVSGIMGYGHSIKDKIAIKPFVTFAGNVKQLGLGHLLLVSNQQNNTQFQQLGILADQGGAFDNNLFQLDLLVDSYYGWTDYHQANQHLPDYTNAWLLLKKDAHNIH